MTFTDDTGRRVSLAQAARRIVSLAPSCTENLFAIGAGDRVVGVTTADDYPPGPALARLPRVGNLYQPSVERIRTLRPDLIVVDSETLHRGDMDALQSRLQAPVYAMSSHRYADVSRQLVRLGDLTGRTADAHRMADVVAARGAKIAASVRGSRPVTVFLQIDTSALYAAGPDSFMDDLIRLAGGTNIVRGSNPYPLVSKEAVIAADPAFYIFTIPFGAGGNKPALPPVDPVFRNLTAVKSGRVRVLDANLLSRPTPRLAEGLASLARVLHDSPK